MPPRLIYYFIRDYKNVRKGPPNRAINFYYAGRRVRGIKGDAATRCKLLDAEAGRDKVHFRGFLYKFS